MKLAERFGLPVLTFIDTAGAYPGIDAEERGQAEAIARNLDEMAALRVPIVVTVTGEGGSGGALALGRRRPGVMLEYAIYSVISPEGCAAILWKDQERKAEAAEAMKITAPDLLRAGRRRRDHPRARRRRPHRSGRRLPAGGRCGRARRSASLQRLSRQRADRPPLREVPGPRGLRRGVDGARASPVEWVAAPVPECGRRSRTGRACRSLARARCSRGGASRTARGRRALPASVPRPAPRSVPPRRHGGGGGPAAGRPRARARRSPSSATTTSTASPRPPCCSPCSRPAASRRRRSCRTGCARGTAFSRSTWSGRASWGAA